MEPDTKDAGGLVYELKEGMIVGKFQLLRSLGGGMGEVWLALDTGPLGRLVALKSIPHAVSEDLSNGQKGFREVDETSIHASVTFHAHPNFPTLFDAFDWGPNRVLVMEYLPGPSLTKLISAYPAGLPGHMMMSVLQGVLRALHHIHRHQFIHRDLKPDNIVLFDYQVHHTRVIRINQVKVVDFGIARWIPLDDSQLGIQSGTPPYMSPEVWQGTDETVASDLYAFGVLAYQVVTGKLPLLHDSSMLKQIRIQDWQDAHLGLSPRPIQDLRADVPQELAGVIMQCLEKAVVDRPASSRHVWKRVMPSLIELAGAGFPAPLEFTDFENLPTDPIRTTVTKAR